MNNNKLNFALDLALIGLFALITISILGGGRTKVTPTALSQMWDVVHYASGALMLMISAAHIFLHWDWIKIVILRKPTRLTRRVQTNRMVDILLFGLSFLCGLSGAITGLMTGSLPDPFVLSFRAWSGMHRLSGTIVWFVMAIHVGLHWKWLGYNVRRYLKPATSPAGQGKLGLERD
jgi:hypothetical protein